MKYLPFYEALEDCSRLAGKVPQASCLHEGDFPVIGQGKQLVEGFTNDSGLVFRGDLPVILFGDHTAAFKFIDHPFARGADGTKLFRPRTENLDAKFVWHFLQTARLPMTGYDRKTKYLESLEIPLPPLEEQRRIAAILDKAAFLNQRGDEAFAKIEQLERAVFEAYFGAHALEEYWETGPLADFCSLITDGEHQTPERTPSGIKLLSARNIRDGRLDLRKVDYVPLHEYERISRRCGPKRGDIFISCSGSIGRVSTYDSDEPVALVRSVALVRPLKAKLRPIFLEFLLRSPRLQALMNRAANASSQANLFQGPIKALQVFAPPLERQDAFIAEITSLRRLEACCQYRISRLNELSASVMKQSFAS